MSSRGATASVSDARSSGVENPEVENRCRSCGGDLHPFIDLGLSPLCESFLTREQLGRGEMFYPLDVKICSRCWLGQLREYVPVGEIFREYAYFSSFSEAWLAHARAYVASVVRRFGLDETSFIIEVASNDGYLLRNVLEHGIPCLGIEPALNVARAAQALGIPTLPEFLTRRLGTTLAREGKSADLVVANNVLAQVPDLNDFVAGLAALLKHDGVATLEFPHLMRLIERNQFDTIYHEHFSYFSLAAVEHVLTRHGLRVFDVEELWTHGGSLRVYACPASARHAREPRVERLVSAEAAAGVRELATYQSFEARVVETKRKLMELLFKLKRQGKRIVGYGAPGKGNTLLNYCGIRGDVLDFTVDRNPYKHGRWLPGSRIPVEPIERIGEVRPDYVMILPWNLEREIVAQLSYVRRWGASFIVPIPEPKVID